jgi:hypothetical protein
MQSSDWPEFSWIKSKVMVFGGIMKDCKSTLIIAGSDTVNVESSMDDFLDQGGNIPI